ncbi:MAG TPA: tryptophanase [Gemmatimonadaceae bacterium]
MIPPVAFSLYHHRGDTHDQPDRVKFNTIIEPFRIRTVEPIRQTTESERRAALDAAHNNVFLLKSRDVLIDLLTDSGTGAMSIYQWAGMMKSDESYAGARSFDEFERSVRDITGFTHVIPTHQGRAAEHILFHELVKRGDIVPNNTHFDTTRANVEDAGGTALDLPLPEGTQSESTHPFKGNMNTAALEHLLATQGERVPLVMLTVTNNSQGGQAVSLMNVREVSELCKRYEVPFFIDACRFAENAWLIKTREASLAHRSARSIAQEMFGLADGCTMSAKKDGMSNIGGFLAMNNGTLATHCRSRLVLTEGFPTYGGLAGYDLEAIAVGLQEALDEDYLRYRIRSIEYLGEKLLGAGVPVVTPMGGHALYLDARQMLPHIPQQEYPAWALSLVLYLEGGIRAAEIGSVMFGRTHDGRERPARMELVRLAFPRRVYTQSHVDYVAEVVEHVNAIASKIRGVRIVEAPAVLRHFTARMAPVHGSLVAH